MNITIIYIVSISIAFIATIITTTIYYNRCEKPKRKDKLRQDITTEQMIESEKRLQSFLNSHNLEQNASLAKIAKSLNVVSQNTREKLYNNQANISEPDENGVRTVVFDTSLNEEEIRFAFAHECSHLINGDSTPAMRPSASNKPSCEQLADYMAAAILLPLNEMSKALNESNFTHLNNRKKLSFIRKICAQYQVNDIVAIRRISEVLHLQKCKPIE